MFKTKAKKIEEVLFGRCNLRGGLFVVADLSFPQVNAPNKKVEWRGNEGLILHLIERIEALEKSVKALETKKSK